MNAVIVLFASIWVDDRRVSDPGFSWPKYYKTPPVLITNGKGAVDDHGV